jgi:hypothetical protein
MMQMPLIIAGLLGGFVGVCIAVAMLFWKDIVNWFKGSRIHH